MLTLTEQEYLNLVAKRNQYFESAESHFPADAPKKKPSKYRNTKVYVYEDGYVSTEKTDGHGGLKEKFDSIKEYNRCVQLRMLERAGKISGLKQQVPFLISSAFIDKVGKKHQAIVYRADFVYVEDGEEVVEDVKGYSEQKKKYLCTEAFQLKWKLLQQKYQDKIFRIF